PFIKAGNNKFCAARTALIAMAIVQHQVALLIFRFVGLLAGFGNYDGCTGLAILLGDKYMFEAFVIVTHLLHVSHDAPLPNRLEAAFLQAFKLTAIALFGQGLLSELSTQWA